MKSRRMLAIMGVLALLLVACAQAATPTAKPTPAPTQAAAATATPVPRATATATPAPVATPTPEKTPTSGPKYGGTLHWFVPWDQVTWDLQKETGSSWTLMVTQGAAFSRLYEPAYPKEGACEQPYEFGVAESYKWVDDLTLDVKLKQGVRFHNKPPVNGREATAQDVAFSYNRLRDVAISSQIRPSVDKLDRAEAVDRYTTRFHFKSAFGLAPQTLLFGWIGGFVLPPEVWGPQANIDPQLPDKSWIGTGPFVFKEWRPGVKFGFTRNDRYFKEGRPYLDGLDALLIPDVSTRMAGFRSGKLDLITELSVVSAQELAKQMPQARMSKCSSPLAFGSWWMRTDEKPFNDVRVRRAVSMAIDRQGLVNALFLGEGEILVNSPAIYGRYAVKLDDLSPDVRQYLEYNPQEAKRLLAEAGYPNGFETTAYATTAFGAPHPQGIEAFLSMLEKVGIKAKPVWQERGLYSSTTLVGKYEGLGWGRPTTAYPYTGLSVFHSSYSSATNRSHVKDPELDKLIEEYQATRDEEKRIEAAKKIQVRMVDQAYLIQLPSWLQYAFTQPYVRDYGAQGYFVWPRAMYERVWFDR